MRITRLILWLQLLLLGLLLLLSSTVYAQEEEGDEAAATEEEVEEEEAKIVASVMIELSSGSDNDEKVPDDQDERCAEWANGGECEENPDYMLKSCATSCKELAGIVRTTKRKQQASAIVYDGEDAGIGAFRFAEDFLHHTSDNIDLVLEVARKLQTALAAEESDGDAKYKPPKDITHCGKRPCTAGKLWKRAEEMRKADFHDSAGADLIRALLKTGIEVDFQEKCLRSLKWAIGSISRQRERERREAIEEEKQQQRRLAERQAMEEAMRRKEEYENDFVKFGTQIQEKVKEGPTKSTTTKTASANVGADGTVETETEDGTDDDGESAELIHQVYETFVQEGAKGGKYNETLQIIKKIPPSAKTTEVLLIEARCHEMLGNHKFALSAAGRLMNKAADHTPWINDSPRMMAATLGANAAMQLGLSDNALQFYQTVLKFDPEQKRARKQYRGLKKVIKLMGKAEEQIQKGYNKAASVHVDDCLSAMRGLDVDSPLFRSKIQLKQCTILSGMGKYEEALENCDTAVELRVGNDFVSPQSKKEAHLVRAEALLLDMDYDEAVQDLRAAFELTADDADDKRELHHKLQSTMHQQELWNGGKKDWHYNEDTGYPDGMPPQRDHAKILQLPIDLEERAKDVKCAWLRKQFKTLVKKYHPDKYKGNKKRAARKFKEVKEAKEIISSDWGC